MADKELIEVINKQMDTHFMESIPMEHLQQKLISLVNDLIQNDFQKLVFILYRVDVDEKKLKNILKAEAGTDAAPIIAQLIIERELQKIETRRQFRSKNNPDPF